MDTEDLPSTTFTIPYSQPIHAALTALINDKLMPKTRATLYKVTKQYGRIDAELAKKLKQEMEHAKVMSKKVLRSHSQQPKYLALIFSLSQSIMTRHETNQPTL